MNLLFSLWAKTLIFGSSGSATNLQAVVWILNRLAAVKFQTVFIHGLIDLSIPSDDIDAIAGRHPRKDPRRRSTFDELIAQVDEHLKCNKNFG
ncbi:hypothetical protein L1987_64915 [Smallanthus sonchifolius]|uniref:Uncharacterized protein n=1 Tax=Smallanthus sonchifolius TaxID=185202 RepID=A0ACB9BT95_9ASTR|nr:hypothetical protein L1987_64915 [Smallanthus sonchifolius]